MPAIALQFKLYFLKGKYSPSLIMSARKPKQGDLALKRLKLICKIKDHGLIVLENLNVKDACFTV
jgi:hypothetical protein